MTISDFNIFIGLFVFGMFKKSHTVFIECIQRLFLFENILTESDSQNLNRQEMVR